MQFLFFTCLILLITINFSFENHHHHNHGTTMSDISQGLSGWIQNYKEPKNGKKEELNKNKINNERKEKKVKEEEEDDEEEEDNELTCTIKVQKVEKHVGKCVRLRGSVGACQTDKYLDPQSSECMFI
ncbi:hypothetical protein Mgra_00005027 [Meloidogyne graminicola]|uniref:Uncharacterized protein n=1 Tax=Meloidogyne graminicola TaxID=189291 RepID=A0A8S9ZQ09_9BILA|nr:hypothetical protein Mgra_00005027 [Meloidogyne graminicola]